MHCMSAGKTSPFDSVSIKQAWDREIAQRIEELDSGKVQPIPWAEAGRKLLAILSQEEDR